MKSDYQILKHSPHDFFFVEVTMRTVVKEDTTKMNRYLNHWQIV